MRTDAAGLKVCLVAGVWAPSFSGAALRFRRYLPGLIERGIEVDVLCTAPPGGESPDDLSKWMKLGPGEMLSEVTSEGLVHRVKLTSGSRLRRSQVFRRAVLKHLRTNGSQVAHLLTLQPVRGNLLRGLRGTEARSVYSGTLLPAFSENRLKRALQRQWIRHSVQRVDHLVVSSGVMRTFYESLGVTTPIAVIPNGVDLQRFRRPESDSEKRAERRRLGISDTADLILFIGSIIRRKGIDTLLLAFKSVAASNPRAELIMVGPLAAQASSGYSQFARHVHDLVRSSGAEDRIHFTGEVADVAAYLRAADLFVFPSRREGMGNVVLEAMATSLPAVLTPYEGLPSEFGEPGTQYVLVDRDPESLAAHMLMLLRDQGKRRTIGTAARRWVEEHMSLSMVIDSYVTLYRDLADGNILRSDGQEA